MMNRPGSGCGLEVALDVIGGKWKPLVLWWLASGPRRFGELRRLVVGISEKMLIQQLREMERDGIVAREDFREVPPRVEYALTGFGQSLKVALGPLCEWGARHRDRIEETKARGEGPAGVGTAARPSECPGRARQLQPRTLSSPHRPQPGARARLDSKTRETTTWPNHSRKRLRTPATRSPRPRPRSGIRSARRSRRPPTGPRKKPIRLAIGSKKRRTWHWRNAWL